MAITETDKLGPALAAIKSLAWAAEQDYAGAREHWYEVLANLHAVQVQLDRAVDAAVRGARESGTSWAMIGQGLGRTKQAVQARYGGPA